MLYPAMFEEVLAFHTRSTTWVPVPVKASVVVFGCALLVNVSVAVALPGTVGLNVMVKGTLCPAAIV